ncbi:MAG: AAC(3) family N-acetyltransferase [Proteobacteria bacterium]|nr:AAC(3) family N-acetyltransferase [Pseudomonadota bacterium]
MPNDEVVVFLIRTMTFGHRLGVPAREAAKYLLETLEAAVGPERTIVLAAYYPKFSKERVFDLKRSLPSTGIVPTAAIGKPGWIRTRTPTNSYLAHGPKALDLAKQKCTTAWGDDGVLAWLTSVNARIVLMGISEENNGWLAVHHAEEKLCVPYRYFKRLLGACFDDGKELGEVSETLYVCPLEVALEHDHTSVSKYLRSHGCELISDNLDVMIRSAYGRDIVAAGLEILERDEYAFIANPDTAREWVENGKRAEIDALPLENRWPR